jgi:hypothetical protein
LQDTDPHGQGSKLTDTGLTRSNVLVDIDRFDLRRVTDRNGLAIKDVHIDPQSHALRGTVGTGPPSSQPVNWSGATVIGQAHCVGGKRQLAPIKLTIRGPFTRHTRSNLQTYQLEVEDNGKIVNPCSDPDDVVVPVNGYWDDTGAHVIDGRSFSFACTKRDVVTCLDQGYVDDPADPTRYALFKSCTRMLRADYCGTGESHTRTGSFVTMRDNQGIAADDHLEPLAFEAAWNADGAVYMARHRWPDMKPACARPIPECPVGVNRDTGTGAAAPLLFNESCVDHPCRVIVTKTELVTAGVSRTTPN